MLVRELGQQVDGRLPDALPEAVGGGLEFPGFYLGRDFPGLGQSGFSGFHGKDGLQGGGRPIPMARRRLGEHVSHEVHHAPLVFRVRQHGVDGRDESRAAVSDHQSDASQTAFDHTADELLPAGTVLFHAFGHANHRQLEDRALQFRHLQLQLAGLGGQAAFVVAGTVRLASAGSFVSRGVGDLVGLRVEHRVDDPLDLVTHHGVVELYDFLGHGLCIFPIAVF